MADITNLSKFLGDVANAIRAKKDTTDLIPAENFDTEILNIATGTVLNKLTVDAANITEEDTTVKIETTPLLDAVVLPENAEIEMSTSKSLLAQNIGLTPDKIVKGETILNVIGEAESEGGIDTSDANATATDLLAGKTAYVDGEKIEGVLAHNGALNYTPNEDTQTIPAGYTTGGAVKSVMNSAVYRRCLTSAKSILGEVEVDIPTNGQLLYLSGKKNNGFSFDNGATTWVNLADDTEIPLASGSWKTDYSLTFSNLAIDTKVPQSAMKDAYTVLMQVYNTGANFGGWGLYGIGGTYSRETGSWIRMYHGSSNIILTKQAAEYYNSWHIIAYTFDGVSRTAIGYIDGTQLVSGTLSALSPTGNIILGMAEQDAAYFGGRMRNIAIYNRVLSAQEIKDIGTIWAV